MVQNCLTICFESLISSVYVLLVPKKLWQQPQDNTNPMHTFLYGMPSIDSSFEYFKKLSCVSTKRHYIKLNLNQEKQIFDQEPQKITKQSIKKKKNGP